MQITSRRPWMLPIRLAAAAILAVVALGPAKANAADESTCREQDHSACLTSGEGGPYYEKHCTGGEDCHTCYHDPGAVCSALGDDAQDYADDIPPWN